MNKFQILVVEDDAPVRNLITTTLRANNYRFITAGSGESAVSETASHNPDIILLDLGLPDIDGVEVIRRIRSWKYRTVTKLMHWMPGRMTILRNHFLLMSFLPDCVLRSAGSP